MRVYGTSPLFNYVELIFRCKRMFIVAVLLGTAITAFVVHTRASTYDAAILVALTGDPEVATDLGREDASPALRKANRLIIWIQRTPEFTNEIVRNAGLDKKYPEKTVEDIAREVRKRITGPELLNNQYMEMRISWPNSEEAEAILNSLFSRFQEKTIAIETFKTSRKRQVLEQQLAKADEAWNRAAKARISFQTVNYFQLPTQMSVLQGQHDQALRQIDQTRLDLNDANIRLELNKGHLAKTPPTIEASTESSAIMQDDRLPLINDLDKFQHDRTDLLKSYSDSHPKVRQLDIKIADTQKQLDAMKNSKPKPKQQSTVVKTAANPDWLGLKTEQRELEASVKSLNRRMSDLTKDVSVSEAHLKLLPDMEVKSALIERAYELTNDVRRTTQNQLAGAKLDEERDYVTQARSVQLDVKPRAERADSGGKAMMLYAVGPIMGIIIAFIFSLAAEAIDHTLRTPVEVEKYLGKPVLAVIPQMAVPRRSSRKQLAGDSKRSISS
jgi:capsular polysaccharide biosynthesis protein